MSKSRPSQPSANPWEALFSSVTRPLPLRGAAYDGNASASSSSSSSMSSSGASPPHPSASGGYTILVQHSANCASLRSHASSSVRGGRGGGGGGGNDNDNVGYGISGPFLVGRAFEELCRRCDGAVVLVSSIGGVLDVDELLDGCNKDDYGDDCDADYDYDDEGCDFEDDDGISLSGGRNGSHPQTLMKRRDGWMRRFRRNGACVDLSSDPFGWEEGDHSEEDDVDDTTDRDDDDDARCDSLFLHGCTMNKLSLVAIAIRRAAAAVEARRSTSAVGRNPSGDATRRQAVPVVFDTLAPLLHAHGTGRVVRFLKSLRIVVHPSSSSSSSSSSSLPVLSPVVVPVLHESLRPSEQRSLEDVSDALVHLRLFGGAPSSGGGVGGHGPSSASASAAASNTSAVVVVSGIVDLVRRGGGSGRGGGMRGGKLVRHCVPFRVMRSPSTTIGGGGGGDRRTDARGGHYWILDGRVGECDGNAVGDDVAGERARPGRAAPTHLSSGRIARTANVVASSDRQRKLNPSNDAGASSGPRIYYQNDDPEFDDLDEEEGLDDDLDL